VLIYWYSAEIYLIDSSIADIAKPTAVLIGIATLVAGWLAYDLMCKSPLGRNENALAAALLVFVSLAAWVLCHLFSGRGAFLHFGAMLGTIMVANVAVVIIPGQKELVAATRDGREPDPKYGLDAKQRSVHNTYFTLPVLFVMVSNHYAMTFGHRYNWLILIALSVAGALVRVYFVARHKGKASPLPLATGVLLLLAVAAAIVPGPAMNSATSGTPGDVDFVQVESVIRARCTSCHAAQPTQAGFSAPPAGVVFGNAGDITAQAGKIHQQVVVSKVMPIGNLTKMTDDERALIDKWFRAGAKND